MARTGNPQTMAAVTGRKPGFVKQVARGVVARIVIDMGGQVFWDVGSGQAIGLQGVPGWGASGVGVGGEYARVAEF